MKMRHSVVLSVSLLTMGTVLNAQPTLNYFDGKEERSIAATQATYTPTHPDACSEKKPSAAPKPVVAAAPKAEIDSDGDGVFDSKDKCPNTVKGYQVDNQGCPKSVTLHMNFAFASSAIPASSDKDVNDLVLFMKNNPAASITIIGHTDIIGSDKYNQPLSEARAKALAAKLTANGIDDSRIMTSGKGSKEPVASNESDEGRAQNRRIEILIR